MSIIRWKDLACFLEDDISSTDSKEQKVLSRIGNFFFV